MDFGPDFDLSMPTGHAAKKFKGPLDAYIVLDTETDAAAGNKEVTDSHKADPQSADGKQNLPAGHEEKLPAPSQQQDELPKGALNKFEVSGMSYVLFEDWTVRAMDADTNKKIPPWTQIKVLRDDFQLMKGEASGESGLIKFQFETSTKETCFVNGRQGMKALSTWIEELGVSSLLHHTPWPKGKAPAKLVCEKEYSFGAKTDAARAIIAKVKELQKAQTKWILTHKGASLIPWGVAIVNGKQFIVQHNEAYDLTK